VAQQEPFLSHTMMTPLDRYGSNPEAEYSKMWYVQQIEGNSGQPTWQWYFETLLQLTNTVLQPMLTPGSVPQVIQQRTSTVQHFPGPYLQLLSNNDFTFVD